jgi:hypothetical protein
MSLTISEMRLSPNAAKAAQLVMKIHPHVVFTSGRRDFVDQARVMANNVVHYGPAWLKDTYKDAKMVRALMTYVEEHPEGAKNLQFLTSGFHKELTTYFPELLLKFPHVKGDAFDIQWPRLDNGQIDSAQGEVICNTILSLPIELGLQLLLKKEGKLDVIHAQFNHAVEV